MTFREQVAYRAKAILAGLGIAVVGFLGWLVENPDTAKLIQQVVPAPYAQFVPLILAGIAATWLVHRVPNTPAPAVPSVEPDLNTTMLTAINEKNSGEFAGPGAY